MLAAIRFFGFEPDLGRSFHPDRLLAWEQSEGTGSISTESGALAPLNAPNFGQITNDISGNSLTSGDYRVVQLAMKFIF